jgi:hypothetical protein
LGVKVLILVTLWYAIGNIEQSLFVTALIIHKNYKEFMIAFHPESEAVLTESGREMNNTTPISYMSQLKRRVKKRNVHFKII